MKFVRFMAVVMGLTIGMAGICGVVHAEDHGTHKVYDDGGNEIKCHVEVTNKFEDNSWDIIKLRYNNAVGVYCMSEERNTSIRMGVPLSQMAKGAIGVYLCQISEFNYSGGDLLQGTNRNARISFIPGTKITGESMCRKVRSGLGLYVKK